MEQKKLLNGVKSSMYWTGTLYALTAYHHYYGAKVYGTPWRAHVVLFGAVMFSACLLLSWLYSRYHSKWLLNSYLLIATIGFGLAIGIFEGFYNHVVKNVLYFSGLNMKSWRSLFPAPAYEVPDNFIFEGSGMLQFVIGGVQLYSLLKLYKNFKN